ncbi:MAG: urease accessory protein UreF [Hyphomicrobiales bacterium]|nr:urease accessory protein UreF [Hyphomicrobiales bacterium]
MNYHSLLYLLTWLSPAFPTGAFAYSQGLEWSVAAGLVKDEGSLHRWLVDLLHHGSLWSDVIILRNTRRAAPALWPAIACEAAAQALPRERRMETLAQGAAFRLAAEPWTCTALEAWGDAPLPQPVALAILAAKEGIDEDELALGFLQASVANLVSAAVRLVPLGQMAGLRVQAELASTIQAVAQASRGLPLTACGGACFAADIASMRHETQYTRLFRS